MQKQLKQRFTGSKVCIHAALGGYVVKHVATFSFLIFFTLGGFSPSSALAQDSNIAQEQASEQNSAPAQEKGRTLSILKYPDIYGGYVGMAPVVEGRASITKTPKLAPAIRVKQPATRLNAPSPLKKPLHHAMPTLVPVEKTPAEPLERAPAAIAVIVAPAQPITLPQTQETRQSQRQPQAQVKAPKRVAKTSPQQSLTPAVIPAPAQAKQAPTKLKKKRQILAQIEISFPKGKSDLTSYEQAILDKDIVPALRSHKEVNLLIEGYAPNNPKTQTGARRMALSRSLMIREYLLSKGVSSSKMDVFLKGDASKILAQDGAQLTLYKE